MLGVVAEFTTEASSGAASPGTLICTLLTFTVLSALHMASDLIIVVALACPHFIDRVMETEERGD